VTGRGAMTATENIFLAWAIVGLIVLFILLRLDGG